MRSLKLFCLLFICASTLFSQENTNSENKDSYITVSLWPIADPYAPRFRLGYVQYLAPNWKAALDVGYGFKGLSAFFATDNNTGVGYSLWEIRPEVHYIFNPEAKTLKYISAELFYIHQDHVFEDDDYISEQNGDVRFDRADFTRQKYGMHFKFGLFLDIGKNLGFNFFGGLGFRIADKEYSNIINPQDDDFISEWFTGPYEREGTVFGVNAALGIKFYYKI